MMNYIFVISKFGDVEECLNFGVKSEMYSNSL